ncbi:hypothetical protein ABB37_05668 [Leptomonas pyrrhocoris]|uniref:Ribosomal RNA-processing protein 14/surfeit locus protein 6 C-terminal domain-containing protein n=1 Tax=Leptomonas pyrrhocoris TaxID=157538 RepID=A0A0M9FZA6_LEPPY|nr:hypothetical protein ABB37_05668 [Leptomonas pyrrhocoris]KPA79165.1 hypothetical protein ABB37_05668 [Leptomonas pyrrhocoris]|eukprot:XP_015657604.1 hypothetical protein ABB37_05668 [Leptomonas pyrrhocoris]
MRNGPQNGYGGQGGRSNSSGGRRNDYNGARPFAVRTRTRSWERKPGAKPKKAITAEERATQPINHVVPLDISFGNFEFQEMKSLGKRGGGVRELSSLLRQARRKASNYAEMLHTHEGAEARSGELISAAMQRAAGLKVKDDAQRITRALAKRRSKKRQSAKRWAKRIKGLEDSVENIVKDRSIQKQTMRARKDAKVRAKEKKRGVAPGSGGKSGKGGDKGGKGGKTGFGGKKSSKKQAAAGGKHKKGGKGGGRKGRS